MLLQHNFSHGHSRAGGQSMRLTQAMPTRQWVLLPPFFTAFLSLAMLGTRETPLTYASLVPVVVGTTFDACHGADSGQCM